MSKLKDLTVHKIAFVPEGDNKGANVLLFKSKEGEPQVVPSAGGKEDEGSPDHIWKRIYSAIGKALGYEEGPPAQPQRTPEGEMNHLQKNPQTTLAEPAEPEPTSNGQNEPTQKGEMVDMKIDKSKLTPEEIAALEAIEKKAGIPDEPGQNPKGKEPSVAAPATEPASTQKSAGSAPAAPATEGEDIYKGLHPVIKAELERLRKQADAAEERELTEIAKKYEIIGKKAEELVPVLKNLKAAGGEAYDQMISVLDASVTAFEKSGLFQEIGKCGGSGTNNSWATIEKHAETIQKAMPSLTWNQAVDKACEQHPELVEEYEKSR